MSPIVYQLTGRPKRAEELDLPPRQIDLTHMPLEVLQRIFHVGPANLLVGPRRHVNREKAEWIQSYCAESIDCEQYDWQFKGVWSDELYVIGR